jgi:hypothetical protein
MSPKEGELIVKESKRVLSAARKQISELRQSRPRK